jgi:hypothetical protein
MSINSLAGMKSKRFPKNKRTRISLIIQEGYLKSIFPDSRVKRVREESLTWEGEVTPSSLSRKYLLKLVYKRNNGVQVYIAEPKLELAKGEKFLPHVYSTPKQRLCLYLPSENSWNISKLYVKTLIPWACEWLFHYEIWLGSGVWHGGGKHIESESEKSKEQEENRNESRKEKVI